MSLSEAEHALDKFEDATQGVIQDYIQDLKSDKDWIRLKSREAILSRTLPARKMRSLKFSIKSLHTIEDVVDAKEEIVLKMAKAKLNTDETLAYLSIIDNIKDTLMSAKYIKLMLEFKNECKNDPDFQAFLNKALYPPVE